MHKFYGTAGLLLVAGAFWAGFATGDLRAAPRHHVPAASVASPESPAVPPTQVYDEVLRAVRSRYVGPTGRVAVDNTRLTHAAIDGMLSAIGDRYTEYYTPKDYAAMLAEQSGSFVGIGATLDSTQDRRVVIARPLDGSPAQRAGLRTGDVVVAVDNKPVSGLAVETVIERIRGDENTFVRLTINRAGKPIQFLLRREMVQSPVVEARMVDGKNKIGYISLTGFNEQADAQFDAALKRLERAGMDALIFDLRDNPGGLLDEAQNIASRFLPDGPVVWVREKNGQMSSLDVDKAKHRGPLSTGAYPVAVLVNEYSASASEIVAGAIQDGKAGVLVGKRTYGKGLVQTIIPLDDDSAVKITTQHYFTRDKHDINLHRDLNGTPDKGVGGIVPDFPVEMTDADARRMHAAAITGNRDRDIAAEDALDLQLQKALSVLRDRLDAHL